MKNVLFYYGYLNSFNSGVNAWTNDLVVADIGSKYDVCIFGDGIADPSHADYANTAYIINKLKTDFPALEIFGYVTANQALSAFQTKASQWDTLAVNGIFFDEAGYDYGKTRVELNEMIKFVREMNGEDKIFVNSWNIDHVIGVEDDVSFPNTTFNPGLVASDLLATDYYLLENFTVVNSAYELTPQWFSRGNKAKLKEASIQLVALSALDDADVDGQEKFNNLYTAAHLWGLTGVGSSNSNYGASGSVKFWTRPDVTHL